MRRVRALFAFSLLSIAVDCFAGGTLGGTLTNEWGDALVGGQVFIYEHQRSGIVGHINGSYEVRDVPAGLHDVLYVHGAYDSLLVRNVAIADDSTTVLHVVLLLAERGGRTADTVDLMRELPDSLLMDAAVDTGDGEHE